MVKRAMTVLATAMLTAFLTVPLWAQQPPPPSGEFVPVDQLPPSEQLPSARLLVAAYAFVWIAAVFYMWTIWRRVNKVESELRSLEQRRGAGTGR
jgi:CcmD family protein